MRRGRRGRPPAAGRGRRARAGPEETRPPPHPATTKSASVQLKPKGFFETQSAVSSRRRSTGSSGRGRPGARGRPRRQDTAAGAARPRARRVSRVVGDATPHEPPRGMPVRGPPLAPCEIPVGCHARSPTALINRPDRAGAGPFKTLKRPSRESPEALLPVLQVRAPAARARDGRPGTARGCAGVAPSVRPGRPRGGAFAVRRRASAGRRGIGNSALLHRPAAASWLPGRGSRRPLNNASICATIS
jgi:hypothetical protein